MPPQLATLVAEAPPGDEWLHEVKFDGYRMQCLVHGKDVRLVSRNGLDWTRRFPGIAQWLGERNWRSTILDGEIVVLDGKGRSDFQLLQAALSNDAIMDAVLYAFDILMQQGTGLMTLPLVERKAALRRLLGRPGKRAVVRYSEHVIGNGPRVLKESCRAQLEGIIAKRSDAPYASGRSRSWLKVKCIRQQEFVVIGFTQPKGSRERIGALLVAVRDERDVLRYAGRVGSGLAGEVLRRLHDRLRRSIRATAPLSPSPPAPAGTVWVRPEVVVEVRFTEWTTGGLLRHPTFLGLREDKVASQVKRERPEPARYGMLTHPEKVLYPEQGLTKQDLARYYERVAPLMLPHVGGRPLSLVRCPDGRSKSCFYQKHLTGKFPSALRQVAIRQSNGTHPYAVVEDLEGLLALVQIGALELHIWGARADRVEAPDRIVFDLDPGPGVNWAAMCEGAEEVRRLLTEVGLQSWVKTSGGKGVHIVAPIERRATWEAVAGFTRSVAQALEQHAPKRYISRAGKEARRGKIFVDWLRNTRGATAVGAWSTRARAGAPVSVPCEWAALQELGGADRVTVTTVLESSVPSAKDPWREMLTTRQRLPTGAR